MCIRDSSSGFQSYQYRQIEFLLGNKNAAMLKPHAHRADLLAQVQQAYETPSLYDESLRLLARHGVAVPADRLERDWTQPYQASEGVEQAWLCLLYTSMGCAQPPAMAGTNPSATDSFKQNLESWQMRQHACGTRHHLAPFPRQPTLR